MMTTKTPDTVNERAFAFLDVGYRPPKPRTRGITEIRGPYYTAIGPPVSARLAGDDGRARRCAEVRRRVVHADARAGAAGDPRRLTRA